MPDVTVKSIDDMEAIYGGLARRARAELGVTAWGMQVFTLPPDWDGYPNHNHSSDAFDPNQEEVYIPLSGAASLVADGSEFELRPGTMVRVGPDQLRQIFPGPDGIRFVAIGGSPGAFTPGEWTELGADPPNPSAESRPPSDGRAGVRAPDRATPPGAPPALLPDARLAPRRRRRAPGDDAARVERRRPLRAARAAHHLAARNRHERLPLRDRTQTRAASRANRGPRTSAALSRSAPRRPRATRNRQARIHHRDPAPAPEAACGPHPARRARLVGEGGRRGARRLSRRGDKRPPACARRSGGCAPAQPGAGRAGACARKTLHDGLGRGRHRRPRGTVERGRADDDAPRANAGRGCAGNRRLLRFRAAGRAARRDPPPADLGQPPTGTRRLRPRRRRQAPALRPDGAGDRGRTDRKIGRASCR